MKGLVQIPRARDLEAAYAHLQSSARAGTAPIPEKVALMSQWARFDPRLGEQLVAHLGFVWRKLGPLELHEELRHQPWPSSMGVILLETLDSIPKKDRALFRGWMALVMGGVELAPDEHYFIGLRSPGSRLMFEDTLRSHRSYRRWGYFGREALVNKAVARAGDSSRIDSKTRRRILDELLSTRERITVREYREALEGAVTRRVAELDLERHPRLRGRGNTRARFYGVLKRGRERFNT